LKETHENLEHLKKVKYKNHGWMLGEDLKGNKYSVFMKFALDEEAVPSPPPHPPTQSDTSLDNHHI
jgi:hypothetical protein